MREIFKKAAIASILAVAVGCTAHKPKSDEPLPPQNGNNLHEVSYRPKAIFNAPFQTQYSMQLDRLERNANNAARSKRHVILIDRDQLAAYLVRKDSHHVQEAIDLQLKLHGVKATQTQLSAMTHTLGRTTVWSNPNAMVFAPGRTRYGALSENSIIHDVCIVIPEAGDLHSINGVWGYSGRNDYIRKDIPLTREGITSRTTYHEIWHCHDRKFLPLVPQTSAAREKDPLGSAYAIHRAELFADVASALQMYVEKDTLTIPVWADLRALRSDRQGADFAKNYSARVDPEYYSGAIYYTTPGLEAVIEHVKTAGLDRVSKYTAQDIQAVAEEITVRTALSKPQMRLLAGHLEQGRAYTMPVSSQDRSFINDYMQRLTQAEKQILTKDPSQGIKRFNPVPAKKYLDEAPRQTVEEVKRHLRYLALTQPFNDTSFLQLMDTWRAELHSSTPYKQELQDRVLILDALLRSGYIDEIKATQKSKLANLMAHQP
ncbi:MAG: hypothetical protein H6867_00960 [Rhodospirillales bacterium]|nr:hypothetical protein [Rhodospirillales bacterium]MCB9996768.1 hypothetical protein [Rhodospirillales bacterium]